MSAFDIISKIIADAPARIAENEAKTIACRNAHAFRVLNRDGHYSYFHDLATADRYAELNGLEVSEANPDFQEN